MRRLGRAGLVLRALDAGADGVIAPHIETDESMAADPDPSDAIEQVHKVAAQLGRYRMDIVSGLDQARASFRDCAQLVVYNLTATFMQHLTTLRTATPRGN
jgi:hypothetical protein